MKVECYPATAVPHATALYRDYLGSCGTGAFEKLKTFYSPLRCENRWMQNPATLEPATRQAVANLLRQQNMAWNASPATLANLDRFADGASAVVTGQQVGLFGGPLLGLLKAATAVRMASDASRAGHPHVPIFWLASEDHDFDEINQAAFYDSAAGRYALTTLRLPENPAPGNLVGGIVLGDAILPAIEEMRRCLNDDSIADLLASTYTPSATLASAFAAFLSLIFGNHGLIVIDAASRPFHRLGQSALRPAIEDADDIRAALLERGRQLENAGYSSQVMVSAASTLLFLVDDKTGVRAALKKTGNDNWSAHGRKYTTSSLLEILEEAPERISPSALLRPVMQDSLLPTSAYVGGPAEVAYFAQAEVVYRKILGRTTPIVPRYSATLVDPATARLLTRYKLDLPDAFTLSGELAKRLAARAMPAATKRRLAATGNALDRELKELSEWMRSQDAGLGHSADIAASKMQYQMNRLRNLSAAFMLQKNESIGKHADLLCDAVFPHANLQERVVAGASFLAQYGLSLIDVLVEHAQTGVCGHHALFF